MPLFEKILNNPSLFSILRSDCSENNMRVDFCEFLEENFHDKVLILKIDDHYHSREMHNPPKSIDCIVLVKCDDGSYTMYLIELRDISSPSGFTPKEIKEKFNTSVDKFLKNDFSTVFQGENFKDIRAFFITGAYGYISQEKFDESSKTRGLKTEIFQSQSPYEFDGKYFMIEPKVPYPMIERC